MFINNVTGKPIKDITFEGYQFSIPAGVSLVWDKFGKFVLDLYKPAGEGMGIPPVLAATAKQWKGVLYADMRRYELNPELIRSRKDLLKLAKARGLDAETLAQFEEDETIDNVEIAKAINELAVPDPVKYPAIPEEGAAEDVAETAAADALKGSEDTTPAAPTAPVAKAPETAPVAPGASKTRTATPGTGKGSKASTKGKGAAKAAPKTPKTPAKRK